MKSIILSIMAVLMAATMTAQPGQQPDSNPPFNVDTSFVPEASFLISGWKGEYTAIDPGSRCVFNITRTLILNEDGTFSNNVEGSMIDGDMILFKQEVGTYVIQSQKIHFTPAESKTLDLRTYITGEELVYINEYQKYEQTLQFTPAAANGSREWVCFDTKMRSNIDPNKDAVYTMSKLDASNIVIPNMSLESDKGGMYSVDAYTLPCIFKGIIIVDGKKVFVR